MRKIVICICMIITFSFYFAQIARADEISDLKAQMKVMQGQMQEQTRQMEAMRRKVERLENEKKTQAKAPKDIEERLIKVEERVDKVKPSWVDEIKLSGSLYEYYLFEDNAYFDQNRSDRCLESTARLGVKVQPLDNLKLNLGVVGEAVTGDYDEYTAAANDDWNFEFEFANFTADNLFDLPLSLTLGRQNLEFGDGFLIYDFYADTRAIWTGSIRSLYAVRTTYTPEDNLTIDAFAGEIDEDCTSYEAFMKDGVTYQGRRNIFGVNTNYKGKKKDIWDLGVFYKNDESSLDSDTLVLSLRGSVPDFLIPGLKVEGEFVPEFGTTKIQNGGLSTQEHNRTSFGGHLDFTYKFKDVKLSPYINVGYRYFPGDDPDTGKVESFDPMFYGSNDWGKWFIGNINGFNVFNTNERAVAFETGINPSATTSLRLLYVDVNLDRENNADAGKRFSREWNLIFEWFPNEHFFYGAEFSIAHPLKAAKVYAGDDENTLEAAAWAGVLF
ncbi:MAG: hypothetical protein ABIH71_07540 [Candidatus Omnitrophota bacterium]